MPASCWPNPPAIAPEDRRLTQIIRDNAERVSRIIENVLELSRRGARQPERIDLAAWINEFWAEFCATQQIAPRSCALRVVRPAEGQATSRSASTPASCSR